MNILYIVPYVPDLVRVRPYNLIRNLTALGHHVTVATLWSSKSEWNALDRLKTDCFEIIAEKINHRESFFSCVSTLPTRKPLQAAYSWQPDLARKLISIIEHTYTRFDVVHVEHLRGSRYGTILKSIVNSHNNKLPIVWDSVDCISLLFRQASIKSRNIVNRFVTQFETNRTYDYEKWLINQFDRVVVTSHLDKNAFESMIDSTKGLPTISVIPNGVDLDYFHPIESITRKPATLVISGKMSYHANITMVIYLVREIMPIVWSKNKEVKLWIVGKDPHQSIKNLSQNPAIHVTGTVDDIRPYLQNATVAVAPVTYGAGIQNKVLEAMACGTPVIASSQAISALSVNPEKEVIIANEPMRFARSILDLLEDPIHQQEIGQAARHFVEKNHQWKKITLDLEHIYRQLVN